MNNLCSFSLFCTGRLPTRVCITEPFVFVAHQNRSLCNLEAQMKEAQKLFIHNPTTIFEYARYSCNVFFFSKWVFKPINLNYLFFLDTERQLSF